MKSSLIFKGTLYEGGYTPSNLNNVKLKTYDSGACSSVALGMTKNWNAQICAGKISRFFEI
jgi:hypothetical protein